LNKLVLAVLEKALIRVRAFLRVSFLKYWDAVNFLWKNYRQLSKSVDALILDRR